MAVVTFQGRVVSVGGVIQVTDKFRKLEVVCEEVGASQYTNVYKVQALNNQIEKAEGLRVGDVVKFQCELSGRRYQKEDMDAMYFINMNVMDFTVDERVRVAAVIDRPQALPQTGYPQPQYVDLDKIEVEGPDDDLPF